MTNGFHHIAITAADFDRTIQFYAQGLGFSLKRSWGEPGSRAAMLDLGDGGCIEIFEGSGQIPQGSDPKAAGCWLHLAVKTSDTRALFQQALAAGATVHQEPADLTIQSQPHPLPVPRALAYGPDGELIESCQER